MTTAATRVEGGGSEAHVANAGERRRPYVAVVSGSPVQASRTLALARYVGAHLARDGADVHYVNVRDLPAEDLLWARPSSPEAKSACAVVQGAEGVVFLTPVYNAAYSGVLKAFLDMLPQFGLRGKAALPIAVGGTVAHKLVIDYALRPVLASMGTPHVVAGVFLLNEWIRGHDAGELIIDDHVAERLQQSLRELGRVVQEQASFRREA